MNSLKRIAVAAVALVAVWRLWVPAVFVGLALVNVPSASAQRADAQRTRLTAIDGGLEQTSNGWVFVARFRIDALVGLDAGNDPIGYDAEIDAIMEGLDTDKDDRLDRAEVIEGVRNLGHWPALRVFEDLPATNPTEDEKKALEPGPLEAESWWEFYDTDLSDELKRTELPHRAARRFVPLPAKHELRCTATLSMFDTPRTEPTPVRWAQAQTMVRSGEIGTLRFRAIPDEKRLMKAQYRIRITFDARVQSARGRGANVTDLIWEDRAVDLPGGNRLYNRINPRRISPLRRDVFVYVGAYDDLARKYDTIEAGITETTRFKLAEIELLQDLRSDLKKQQEDEDANEPRNRVSIATLSARIARIEAYDADDLRDLQADSEAHETALRLAIQTRTDELYRAFERSRDDVRRMAFELWYKAMTCHPDAYGISGNYAAGSKHPLKPGERHPYAGQERTLERDRRLWGSIDFIRGSRSDPASRGSWKRDEWLEWLKQTYFVACDALLDRYNRLYGTADARDEYFRFGNDPETARPRVFSARFQNPYRQLGEMIASLRRDGMAFANLLCEVHADEDEPVPYAFPLLARNGDVADPNRPNRRAMPRAAQSIFNGITTAAQGFARTLDWKTYWRNRALPPVAPSDQTRPPSDGEITEGHDGND